MKVLIREPLDFLSMSTSDVDMRMWKSKPCVLGGGGLVKIPLIHKTPPRTRVRAGWACPQCLVERRRPAGVNRLLVGDYILTSFQFTYGYKPRCRLRPSRKPLARRPRLNEYNRGKPGCPSGFGLLCNHWPIPAVRECRICRR